MLKWWRPDREAGSTARLAAGRYGSSTSRGPTIGPTEVLVRTMASVVSPGTERAVTAWPSRASWPRPAPGPTSSGRSCSKARADGLAPTARRCGPGSTRTCPWATRRPGMAVEVGEAVSGCAPASWSPRGAPGGQPRRVPGGAGPAVRAGPRRRGPGGRRLRHRRVDRPARPAPGRGRPGRQGRRRRPGPGRPARRPAGHGRGLRCRRHRRLGDRGRRAARAPAPSRWWRRATTRPRRSWSGRAGAAPTPCCSWRRARRPTSCAGRPALCRDRATVVVVGDVGLDLERRRFYERELTLRFARSYGPGRYERSYEEWGVDYPRRVRCAGPRAATSRRSSTCWPPGDSRVDDLVTHRFAIDEADRGLRADRERSRALPSAIGFDYPTASGPAAAPVVLRRARTVGAEPGVGLIGAGAFAPAVLAPGASRRRVSNALRGGRRRRRGSRRARLAERAGFEKAVSAPRP